MVNWSLDAPIISRPSQKLIRGDSMIAPIYCYACLDLSKFTCKDVPIRQQLV